jgi:rhodanese-related sulfurtransferase
MPTTIFRDEVRRLLTKGVQLVDVLPAQEYRDLHLPGAINIPLKELTEQATAQLQSDRPLIVYCHDYQ